MRLPPPAQGNVKRNANDLMRTTVVLDGELPFFCECDDPSCLRTVWLSVDVYDHLREGPDWRPIAVEHRRARLGEDRALGATRLEAGSRRG